MSILRREEIFAVTDLASEVVEVPEWGGQVIVRGLTAGGRDRFEASIVTASGITLEDIRAKLVALTVVGEDGRPLFTMADVPELTAKSAAAMDRIFSVAQRLSGLSKTDVDDLLGNSIAGPRAGFSSFSPSGSE